MRVPPAHDKMGKEEPETVKRKRRRLGESTAEGADRPRADNGPELTARVLREWCEAGFTATAYIDPGSPWQNACSWPRIEGTNRSINPDLSYGVDR